VEACASDHRKNWRKLGAVSAIQKELLQTVPITVLPQLLVLVDLTRYAFSCGWTDSDNVSVSEHIDNATVMARVCAKLTFDNLCSPE